MTDLHRIKTACTRAATRTWPDVERVHILNNALGLACSYAAALKDLVIAVNAKRRFLGDGGVRDTRPEEELRMAYRRVEILEDALGLTEPRPVPTDRERALAIIHDLDEIAQTNAGSGGGLPDYRPEWVEQMVAAVIRHLKPTA